MTHPPKIAKALEMLDESHRLRDQAASSFHRQHAMRGRGADLLRRAAAFRAQAQQLAREHHGDAYRGRC